MRRLTWAILLAATVNLTGCAVVAVGGAAAGGYYVGKDERSVGEITDDAAITAKINAKYLDDDRVKTFDIDVDTYRGTVHLYGRVDSIETRERAERLARSVKGVKQVVSQLTVASAP